MRRNLTRRLLVFGFLVSIGSCSTDPSSNGVVVLLEVEPPLVERASAMRVRVFDTDGQLALDEERSMGGIELPLRVPLFPDGEGNRSYHVVAELRGGGGEALGVQRAIGGYVDGESRILRARFADACDAMVCAGHETCRAVGATAECVDACFDPQPEGDESLPDSKACPRVVWVDGQTGTDDPAACTGPDAPCADVNFALDNYLANGTGGVLNAAGGSTYDGFLLRNDDVHNHSGTIDTPTVVRAWPGTGRPMFDGGSHHAAGTCCSTGSADNFVLEGLEVVSAVTTGIMIHGENVNQAVVRDCVVRGVRFSEPVRYPTQAAGIALMNLVSNVTLVGNRIETNTEVGISEDDTAAPTHGISISNTEDGHTVEGNVVVGNSGHGLYLSGGANTVRGNTLVRNDLAGIYVINSRGFVVEDNVICDPGTEGIWLNNGNEFQIRHNTLVGSEAAGILLTNFGSDNVVTANIFAFGAAAGIEVGMDGRDPMDQDNLYWMNAFGAHAGGSLDGMNWDDTLEPVFQDRAGCDLTLVDGSEAAGLIDGEPVGARFLPDE